MSLVPIDTDEPVDVPVQRKRWRMGCFLPLLSVVLLVCGGGGVVMMLGNEQPPLVPVGVCGTNAPVQPNGPLPKINGYSEEQVRNAAIIVSVGQKTGVPARGWVVAVATSMQESALRNLPHLGDRNDHDSLGLFQQRPSKGWGTPQQIMDPVYSSSKFYAALVKIVGWQSMPLTEAAQRVQKSAYPDAYAKHEPKAAEIVNALTRGGANVPINVSMGVPRCIGDGDISASGWTVPVRGSVGSGFRTPDRPGHNGVDVGAPKGATIRAATSGIVLVSECNASTGNCDVDGSPSISGCGWYVDILHAGKVITRYCHMVSRPSVSVGKQVLAGEVIGLVGSSGNSSGPHLHYEVHLNGDESNHGAVDPVAFMARVGAPLGR